jgi:hypothetical protein
MPSDPIFKLKVLAQNVYPGTETIPRVRHIAPEVDWSDSGHVSLVAEFTGTASHSIAVTSGPTAITVDGSPALNPITGAYLVPANISGVYVRTKRADAATVPTGSVTLEFVNGFAGVTTSDSFDLGDDAAFLFHRVRGDVAANLDSMTVSLVGTTGYKVSVLVWMQED